MAIGPEERLAGDAKPLQVGGMADAVARSTVPETELLTGNWLRVSDTTKLPHIDQSVRQQLHTLVQLRGLDHPRKRACLTAVHHFFLTRPDGTTAAERFFGQKPRSMFAAILASVEIPPAPLSPPRRAVG